MSEQKCIICDAKTNKILNISYSNIGPEGESHHGAGRLFVCREHIELVKTMPTNELQLFMRANAPVKERDETSGEAVKPFESHGTQSNGNGLT